MTVYALAWYAVCMHSTFHRIHRIKLLKLVDPSPCFPLYFLNYGESTVLGPKIIYSGVHCKFSFLGKTTRVLTAVRMNTGTQLEKIQYYPPMEIVEESFYWGSKSLPRMTFILLK